MTRSHILPYSLPFVHDDTLFYLIKNNKVRLCKRKQGISKNSQLLSKGSALFGIILINRSFQCFYGSERLSDQNHIHQIKIYESEKLKISDANPMVKNEFYQQGNIFRPYSRNCLLITKVTEKFESHNDISLSGIQMERTHNMES